MSRILIIIILLFTTNLLAQNYGYKPQKVSLKARKQVNILKKETWFTDEAIGFSSYKSDTYKCFEKLQSLATTKEFIELCKHPSPVIRYYAFFELKKRKVDKDILLPIVKTHLNDTATIYTIYGCERYPEEIGSFMFSYISKRYKSDQNFRNEIDDLFLYSKEPLIYIGHQYLQSLPKTDKHYNRLKEMVKVDHNFQALLPLLDYNNTEDWTYIQYVLDKSDKIALEAIKRYPKTEFIPYLKSLQLKFLHEKEVKDMSSIWWVNNNDYLETIYSIYLKMNADVFQKQTANIFHNTFNNEARIFHSKIIYNLVKEIKEPWVNPIVKKLLPYLSHIDKDQLILQVKYDINSLQVFHEMLFNKTHQINKSTANNLINILRNNQSLDSNAFFQNILNDNPNSITFSIISDKLITYDKKSEKRLYLIRFEQLTKENFPRLDDSFISKLDLIKDENFRSKLWRKSYNYIINQDNFCYSYLKLMMNYEPNSTIKICFNIIKSNSLSKKLKWNAYYTLKYQSNENIDQLLKKIYIDETYVFKQSRLGKAMKKELFEEITYY